MGLEAKLVVSVSPLAAVKVAVCGPQDVVAKDGTREIDVQFETAQVAGRAFCLNLLTPKHWKKIEVKLINLPSN